MLLMSSCRSRRDRLVSLTQLRDELCRVERELAELRVENEILREAAEPLIHHARGRERFAFIDERRGRFGIRLLCRVLVTDPGNYYAWVRAQARRVERKLSDVQIFEWILEVHTAHPAYGAVRVTRELKACGFSVGCRRVARIMREHGVCGITRRRRRNLTKADQGAAAVPDLIQRSFTAPMLGLKLTGDMSYFPTAEGWVYLATVLDLCTKELIGYAVAPHMRASLVIDALASAHGTGLVAGNAIMHTDRGSQYHAKSYRNVLKRLDIRQSTSRTGSCLDGAAAESFFATIKTEIGTEYWADRASACRDIENWITDYNARRLHSAIGYSAPAVMRRAWQERMSMAA